MPNVLETLPDDAYRPEDRPASQPPSGDPEALRRLAAWSRHEPVMLLVVAQKLEKQLGPALELRDLRVHIAAPDSVVQRVTRLTPDLVVLDDTLDAVPMLRELSTDPAAASSPVVVLTEKAALAERLRAFRHGAALVLPLTDDIGAMALEIERAARGAAGLEAHEVVGAAGEATLDELVKTLESELRTGILSVWPSDDSEATATRLVLGGGRPLTAAIDSFVRTVRENVVSAEPLRYEFEQYAGGEVEDVVESELVWDAPSAELSGLRVLLADADAPRADAVAMALRDRGVEVFVADLAPPEGRFRRLRETDPAAILISRYDAERSGYDFIREVRRDVRLRWANLLLVNWDGIWDDASGASVDTPHSCAHALPRERSGAGRRRLQCGGVEYASGVARTGAPVACFVPGAHPSEGLGHLAPSARRIGRGRWQGRWRDCQAARFPRSRTRGCRGGGGISGHRHGQCARWALRTTSSRNRSGGRIRRSPGRRRTARTFAAISLRTSDQRAPAPPRASEAGVCASFRSACAVGVAHGDHGTRAA